MVEVLTPAGHASSYPPHKHDVDDIPVESFLEETYFHRLNPPQGFGFQRVSTDARDLDEALTKGTPVRTTIEDGVKALELAELATLSWQQRRTLEVASDDKLLTDPEGMLSTRTGTQPYVSV